jgi:EamA domain-containing membrane protein RarD
VVRAVAVLFVITGIRRGLAEVAAAFRNRRALVVLSGSTVAIAINWFVYIYSVTHDRPLAAGYLVWAVANGHARFLAGDHRMNVLLLLAGPLTAIPLLLFAEATRRRSARSRSRDHRSLSSEAICASA